jgi:uncharacterized Zn-binding protein involved in type VI secretion
MPMGPAARILDPVVHPAPGVLTPGPGSPNVIIGNKLAWRGVPAGAAAAISAAKATSDKAIATAEAATVAAAGTPGLPAAKAAEQTAKATAATNMGAMITAAAGGADIHACTTPLPLPPHGPGVVIDGSPTVLINGLPACRQGDTIVEAVGPPDKIAVGLQTVIIGNVPNTAAGGSAGGGAGTAAAAKATAPSNGPFATADEAAKAALNAANPQSIKDNLEYSGLIYKGVDGKFYYTGPAKGTDQGANPKAQAPAPPGTQVVADYHTHGDYSTADPATGAAVRTKDPSKDAFNSDQFSAQDKSDNRKEGYPGYLGTPSGTFRKYDPATGNDTVLR